MFLKGFHVAPAGIFINCSILVKSFPFCLIEQTAGEDKLDIDLDSLSGIRHLLIRLRDVLEIRKFLNHNPLFFRKR